MPRFADVLTVRRIDWTLDQFMDEVLLQPLPAPTLPCHLPDLWLDRLLFAGEIRSIERVHPDFALANTTFDAALISLLDARYAGSVLLDEASRAAWLARYHAELLLDELARQYPLVIRATLDDIFTDRFRLRDCAA